MALKTEDRMNVFTDGFDAGVNAACDTMVEFNKITRETAEEMKPIITTKNNHRETIQ